MTHQRPLGIQPSAPIYAMRGPDGWLHWAGDRLTPNKAWRWTGNRKHVDAMRAKSELAKTLTLFQVKVNR